MTQRNLLLRSAVALVLCAAVLLGPVPVTIDGYPRWIAHGTTVGELIARGGVRAFPGDLIDVHGGYLLPRAGGAPIVTIDGSATPSWGSAHTW
jgi:hypothetical protein